MKNFYKQKFAITDNGAKDLVKSTFLCFMIFCMNMLPVMLMMFFLEGILTGNLKSSAIYIGLAIAVSILIYIFLRLEYDAMFNATYKESANLRTGIAESLSRLPLSYFSKHDLSDLSQTIMSDVEGIEHAMSHAIPKVYGFYIFFPIISIMMLMGNVKLALAVIIPIVLSFTFIYISKKVQIKGHKKYYNILRENSESFQEGIELQQEIQSFNLSSDIKKNLYKEMEESEKVHIKENNKLIRILGFSSAFGFISIASCILIGIMLLMNGEINIIYLIGYLLAAIKIKDMVDGIEELLGEIFYLDPKIKRIKDIRKFKTQKGKDTKLKNFDIQLENVSFSYDKDTPILKDVSFVAKQGQVTAIVGASGCGKTSILRLVSRLYDYDKGKIMICGKDIKEISTDSLFDNISIVFQDVTLFNSSVMENIRIGNKNATDAEVKEAAKLAGCTDFIKKMENGYDTLIGENGAELSGGERQRLSIARAFLKDAPILLLDEIAASLDVDNEEKIQESLNKLIKNKTVIIISHRLKSIENVDKIVVIDNGKVEREGTHIELLNKSKVYSNLIEKTQKAESFVY
ncbi:ABC transporter ATP-binding protein [Hathewaya limosa]|uniref:ATP-binding cassette subfamily B protein n=1 Tax=Hathewaya limosa TaxID=1536 RepID=A0ABU0JWM1_HATLI|nr:ABC transporter ATP-binding protein [Hathewaya limosa]MDQ0480312.1 ATP-binding cassette subfamily B protein [Hathewaya limosa]